MVIHYGMRYHVYTMSAGRKDWDAFFSGRIVKTGHRGIPFIPGLLLIVLGVVVLIAPRLVLATIALCLLSLGALFCYIAYKLVAFKRQVQSLTKTFEASFHSAGFDPGKRDIEVTEFESKKIILH